MVMVDRLKNRAGLHLFPSFGLGRGLGIVPTMQKGKMCLGGCQFWNQGWAGGSCVA